MLGFGGASRIFFKASATGVAPVHGTTPVTNSYSTTPNEYKSARGPAGRSSICSGAIYVGVPSPICGSACSERTFRASPKSVITARPVARSIRMLADLKSRCTIPKSCAAANPAASGAYAPSRVSRSRNDSPSTHSIVKNADSSCSA